MDNPIELTDGRLVCRAHRQVVCAKCTVDYSFMDDISDEENKEESDGDELLTEEEMKAFRQRMIAKKGRVHSIRCTSTKLTQPRLRMLATHARHWMYELRS